MTDQTSETTPDGLDVAAVRERLERLHELARGHDYADAKELAAGEDAIEDVLAALDEAQREAERLSEEVMAHQVGDGYEKGYEHGSLAGIQHYERMKARAAAAESARDAAEGVVAEVRAELASEDVQAVLFGVTGTHPEAYGGVTKDEALECAGEVLTRLRAILDRLAPVTTDATEGEA